MCGLVGIVIKANNGGTSMEADAFKDLLFAFVQESRNLLYNYGLLVTSHGAVDSKRQHTKAVGTKRMIRHSKAIGVVHMLPVTQLIKCPKLRQ